MIPKTRNVLITGGSSGIGAGIVVALAKEGNNVYYTYKTNKERAISIQQELNNQKCLVTPLEVDLGKDASFEKLLIELNDIEIDILINNAATLQYCNFIDITPQIWDYTQKVNVRAPFFLSQFFLPKMMRRKWGRIINMTSIGGQWGGTLAIQYAVSKSALIGLTRSLAKLSARFGVTVNAISPGLVATDIIKDEVDTYEFKQKVENIPLGRIAEISEVVNTIKFLCSEEASYITGQTINVNGGMYFG